MESKLTQLALEKTGDQLKTMTALSFKWLMAKIAEIKRPSLIPITISREKSRQVPQFKLGRMYFFYYDAKTKDDLPYWDRFPLVLVLEKYNDGFLGLNLHYLPIKQRVLFMTKLMRFAILNEEDEIIRMRVTYDILNSTRRFREFRPCLKRYLFTHIRSKILLVQPNEWDVAMFLPIQQFKKDTAKNVWRESLTKIRNS